VSVDLRNRMPVSVDAWLEVRPSGAVVPAAPDRLVPSGSMDRLVFTWDRSSLIVRLCETIARGMEGWSRAEPVPSSSFELSGWGMVPGAFADIDVVVFGAGAECRDAAWECVGAVPFTAGDQVRAATEHLGLTLSDVGRVVRVSRPTLYNWLRGDVQAAQDASVGRRLHELSEIALAWAARGLGSAERFLRVPMSDGRSVLERLQEPEWSRDRIGEGLDAIAERIAAQEAFASDREKEAPRRRLEAAAAERADLRAFTRRARRSGR
jgi:transcriptional regulator with XRE-family HTH domain